MDIVWMLFGTGVFLASIRILRASIARLLKRRRTDGNAAVSSAPAPLARGGIQWLEADAFQRLMKAGPATVLIRISDSCRAEDAYALRAGEVEVEPSHLEGLIRRIPRHIRIAVRKADGIDLALMNQLAPMLKGRDAVVLDGPILESAITATAPMEEICS